MATSDAPPSLGDVKLERLNGDKVHFRDIWEQSTQPQAASFRAVGTDLAFVGHGALGKAQFYADSIGITAPDKNIPMYIDGDRASHKALNLKKLNVLKMVMDSKGISLSSEASKKGFGVTIVGTGDMGQQGGCALFASGADKPRGDDGAKRMRWLKISEKPYDYPEVDELLHVCADQLRLHDSAAAAALPPPAPAADAAPAAAAAAAAPPGGD